MLKKLFIFIFVSLQLYSLEPILVVFGPPGGGKGTFSQFLKEKYGYLHLSVGDLVREEIDKQTDMGKEAEAYLQKGELLKESTIQFLITQHVTPLALNKAPFIIDGFPRTKESVHFIFELFTRYDLSDRVLLILLNANDVTCKERVLSRIVCKQCGHVYNLMYSPPKQHNKCDICFSLPKVRSNDTDSIVIKRLEEYHQITQEAYDFAKVFFPSIEFDTDVSLEDCLKNYTQLIEGVNLFRGNTPDFANAFTK